MGSYTPGWLSELTQPPPPPPRTQANKTSALLQISSRRESDRKRFALPPTPTPEAKHLLFVFDSQTLPFVHRERAGTLAVAVAFRAVLLPVAGSAVDFGVVSGHCGAVQVLPADH